MSRPSNRLQRRRQILEAFMRVLAQRGYAGATTLQVAREARLAPGLIHYHFESKQALLLELFRHLRGLVRERMRRRCSPGDPPWLRLTAFIDAHLALDAGVDRLAVACWQVLGAEALHSPELQRPYRRMLRWQLEELRAILRRLSRGQKPQAETQRAAAAILAGIQGFFHLAATAPRAIPRGSAAVSLRQMARALRRAGPQPRGNVRSRSRAW